MTHAQHEYEILKYFRMANMFMQTFLYCLSVPTHILHLQALVFAMTVREPM